MQQQGLMPDVITYNALISACEKSRQPGQALEVLHALQQQSLVPNLVSWDSLVLACSISGL